MSGPVSVMFSPNYYTNYDIDQGVLTEFAQISTRSLTAYKDSASNPQNLIIGASSNLNLEAVQDANIFVMNGKSIKLYETTIAGSNRTDRNFLTISTSNTSNTVIMPAGESSNAVTLKATDTANTVTVASTTLQSTAGYQVFNTSMLNGFKLAKPLDVQGALSVNASATVSGSVTAAFDVVAGGSVFGNAMNLFQNVSDSNAENLTQVAYAFFINSAYQLDLIRYKKYTNGGSNTSIQEKVATWGTASVRNETGYKEVPFVGISNYTNLDAFNGLASNSSNSQSGNATNGGGFGSGNNYVQANTIGDLYTTLGAKLGINNSNPVYDLDVNGTINCTNIVISPQYVTSSDQRLKENIKLVVDPATLLDTLRKLNVYNYNFKADPDKRLRTGFIAQEVKKQIPNAVIQTEFAGLADCMQIDTDVLIAHLVGAIKVLSCKVDKLIAKYPL